MAASSTSCTYKLSRELVGHTSAVRGLAVFKDGSVVSASRDKTARFWKATACTYGESTIMKGHSDFVCSVCVIEPTTKNPTGFIVTGSNDKNICIYYPGQEEPIHTVRAHENTVCGLKASVLEKESFFSCSYDETGKLWNLYDLEKPLTVYSNHTSTAVIWCIADLLNSSVITGGADKIVTIYKRDGKILHRLKGHQDCIRDIAAINENEFLTCGNDAVTKHWNALNGVCLGTYSDHISHIYSIAALLGGSLAVSCGEDKTVKVWRNGKVDQTIAIPAQTVWCVKLLPNEDLVCGSSDGIVRIFTVNEKRYVDQETMQKFEEAVLKLTVSKQKKKHNDNDMKDIPQSNELNQPGKKDGDTVIVKVGSGIKAYRWSQERYEWILIGDVVKNEETNSGKQIFNGIEYDYVLSVDIEEGSPLLKLPYNKGQDPYMVAKQFIQDNDLNPRYINRVANFIMTSLQISPILNEEAKYSDPFTGGSRYVSNSSTQSSHQPSTSMSPPPNSLMEAAYIPQRTYLKLEQGNISNIHEKLKEFNEQNENGTQSIPADKLESLVKLVDNKSSRLIEEEVNNLKSLLNWPDNIVFPVLDVARLAVLQEDVNAQFCTNGILNTLKRHIQKDAIVSNQMLTFRLLANLFYHEAGEQFCLQCRNEVLTAIRDFAALGNKNNEVALSTYILNLVVALNKTNDTLGKIQTLSVIFRLLEILKETEAVFRILVGLGTLIIEASCADERNGFIKSVKQSRPVLKALRILLEGVESSSIPNKLLSVTRQILELIRT